MSNEQKEPSTSELAALVTRLSAKIDQLEAEVHQLHEDRPVPEEDVVALAAAAAAYLGYRGEIRAVNYASRRSWAAAGRSAQSQNTVRGVMPQA